ncbi:hypothetical protein C8Q77DRAFT_1067864, partial [Trametes polyzona]
LLAYDHLLTFPGEVQFVWGRKFSGATVVFLLNRYVTLLAKIMLPVSTFWWPHQTDQVCFRFPSTLLLLFSALRIYAIWNKDWKPFLFVLIVALSVPATNMVISVSTHSCAIAADLLVLILTWIKTYEIKKLASTLHSSATFSTLLLRDGTSFARITWEKR